MSNPATPQSPLTGRVTSLEDKMKVFGGKLDDQDAAINAHENVIGQITQVLTDPKFKGGLPRTYQGMQSAHRRISVLERALKMGQAGGYKAFIAVLRQANVTDQQLNDALGIMRGVQGLDDLTDAELFAELTTSYISFVATTRDTLTRQGEDIDVLKRRVDVVDGPNGAIARICQQLDAMNEDFGMLPDAFEAQNRLFRRVLNSEAKITRRVTRKGAILSIVAFLGVWLTVLMTGNNVRGAVFGTGAEAKRQIGTYTINLHYGWIGFALGLIVAAIVLMATARQKLQVPDSETQSEPEQEQPPVAQTPTVAAPPAQPATPPQQRQPEPAPIGGRHSA